jgi:hypothetical protein
MPVLKLEKDDENREIEFELRYLNSLTIKERFLIMKRKSDEMKKMMRRRGYRKSIKIFKRAARRPKDLEDLKYLRRLKK